VTQETGPRKAYESSGKVDWLPFLPLSLGTGLVTVGMAWCLSEIFDLGYYYLGVAPLARLRILDIHVRADSAAGGEGGGDFHRARLRRSDQVVQNAVRYVFVERAFAAIALQVKLERLELEAQAVGHVADRQRAEIGLARLRT
jgi:hypothetical protein